ncbi:YhgE/Pip domain-containing protein [Leuconostoc palmae]|uniref:YhgE/Pip domain-containing protein n=1 Tax=Leuconostoc palmae TaxID=501487 RepID=UPI001C7D034F|nr:ABC transporter permease [Leuconostoc palmae]
MLTWRNLIQNKHQLIKWLWAVAIPAVLVIGVLITNGHRTQQAKNFSLGVINLDQGADYQGKKQRIGNKLQRDFQENHDFKVKSYATEKNLKKAVLQGDITAAVIIPKNLTQQLAEFQQHGETVRLPLFLAMGNNAFAGEYLQRVLNQTLTRESSMLSLGTDNGSTLKNIAAKSQELSEQTDNLQSSLQSVGSSLDAENASDLRDTASDTATKLASYSAQLNDAVNAGDTTKIQAMAVAINNLSYTFQSDIVNGISNIASSLNQTKALSDNNGAIQSSVKKIKSQQSALSDKLNELFGDTDSDTKSSPLTQMLVFDITDLKPIKQDGQILLPMVIVSSVIIFTVLVGILLPVTTTKLDGLALKEWWQTFSVIGSFTLLASLLIVSTTLMLHVTVNNVFLLTIAIILATLASITLTWYLKQWLGQVGWWLSVSFMIGQAILANISVVSNQWLSYLQGMLPLSVLGHVIRAIVFDNNVQQDFLILILWCVLLTIVLVSYYRMKQRQYLKSALEQ